MFTDEVNLTSMVRSHRVLYTASPFAKASLLYLQEAGTLTALRQHTSSRERLPSFLCFIVLDGCGSLAYRGEHFTLKKGDVAFLDCNLPYSHSTGPEALWTLQWCHFYGSAMGAIYEKYLMRGGTPVLHPHDYTGLSERITRLQEIADSSDYLRDMKINELLASLLTALFTDSWNPSHEAVSSKKPELLQIRQYLEEHFTEDIPLQKLSELFYINKYYLTRIFKERFGTTINGYVTNLRITKAKQLLRFSMLSIDEIAEAVGFGQANYFIRVFHRIEGVTPGEFRKLW